MERDASSLEPMVYSFIFICRSPQKGALPRNVGKTFIHCPRSPTWTEGLHTMGCGLVPQGDRLQHCCHYPSAMQPSVQYLLFWLGSTRASLAWVKGKAVPLQAWTGPEGSRKLRFPDYMTTAQDGGKVVSLTHWPPFTPRKCSWYSFLLDAEPTPGP